SVPWKDALVIKLLGKKLGYNMLSPARRADACCATRSAFVLRQNFFWFLRGAQRGLARPAALPCISNFSSGVYAKRS
ncbi:hypothetical protein A2U01_0076331, partial [Trifolium medium]|nr:hypothetical protein [Trifolium medium]